MESFKIGFNKHSSIIVVYPFIISLLFESKIPATSVYNSSLAFKNCLIIPWLLHYDHYDCELR